MPGRFSLKPLTQHLLNKLGLAIDIEAAATEKVTLCPPETHAMPRAFFLEGQLDRVTGVAEHSSRALEERRLGGVPVLHMPTVAYRIENTVFSRGRLYTRRLRDLQLGDQARKLVVRITGTIDTAALPLNQFATLYFGHMVIDGAAAMMLTPGFGEACVDAGVASGMAGHVARYFDLFNLTYRPIRDVRIRNAWLFDDRGMNSHKSARLRSMGARLRALPGLRSGHGVFIRRRGWGVHRAPENEPQLEDFFAARGFDIIDPRDLTVDQIAARIIGAEVVVGVEGSGMTHGMLALAPGATVVMLLPPSRLNNMMKDYADGLGLHYAFVIGKPDRETYTVDPQEILRTIDLVPAGSQPRL